MEHEGTWDHIGLRYNFNLVAGRIWSCSLNEEFLNADKKLGEPRFATLLAGIVKDGTSSAELRGRTELPNDASFILAFSD